MLCRSCRSFVEVVVADLGFMPPANAYITKENYLKPEIQYPLVVKWCSKCFLVQTEDFTKREDLFTDDYSYFSSYSQSWLQHSSDFALKMIKELDLDQESFVVEIASNDGYMLTNFLNAAIPCLGVEPTKSTAEVARLKGINTIDKFFSRALATELISEYPKADLVISNNVLAHVPDIMDFISGYRELLAANGVATFEFQHLLRLMQNLQFDTLYHEHFSYLSLLSLERMFNDSGLRIFHVEELSTHGGSLRVFVCLKESTFERQSSVNRVLSEEIEFGLHTEECYQEFYGKCTSIKMNTMARLIGYWNQNKRIVAYGAAAKGNTFMNFCGIKNDLILAVGDSNVNKQGKFMPGSRIPIIDSQGLVDLHPDVVLVLPWNLSLEIAKFIKPLFNEKTEFLTAIPDLQLI
jgi:hypothetical protein